MTPEERETMGRWNEAYEIMIDQIRDNARADTRRPSPYHGTLHIIAHGGNHDPAFVVGTAEALTALRDAIDAAIANGHALVRTYAADGEGYRLAVMVETEEGMADVPFGYTDPDFADGRKWTIGIREVIDA